MPNLVEVIGEALQAYWLSPLSLTVLAVCGASMGTLLYVFVTNSQNAKLRVSLLTGLYALSLFFWTFVAGSLVLCVSQARMVAYAPRNTREEEAWLERFTNLLAEFEGVDRVSVGIVKSEDSLALAVGGKERRILVSDGLVHLLDNEETEAVVAHEIMHLKHHDAEFKVFSRVLSRILFFDPFSKFFDPAVHREREYLADETGGRSTGKPAALASALLKIANRGMPQKSAWGLSILGSGRGIFSRYPPLQERVHRLLLLSDLLQGTDERGKAG